MIHLDIHGIVLQATQHTQRQESTHDSSNNIYWALTAIAGAVLLWYRVRTAIKATHKDIDQQIQADMDDRFLGSLGSKTIAELLEEFLRQNHSN